MHGTHVGGLAIKGTKDARLLTVKIGVSEPNRSTSRTEHRQQR